MRQLGPHQREGHLPKRGIITKAANGGKVLARSEGSDAAARPRDLQLHDGGDRAAIAKSFV